MRPRFQRNLGPVALWAATHMMLHIPNAMIMETVRAYYNGWYKEVVTEEIPISDGMLSLPHSPGLGTALREEVLKQQAVKNVKGNVKSGVQEVVIESATPVTDDEDDPFFSAYMGELGKY